MMPTKKKAETWYHQYAYYIRERAGDAHDYRCEGHLGEIVFSLDLMTSILVRSIKGESLMCLQRVPFTLVLLCFERYFLCTLWLLLG